ncbi:MAG: hypothetical protein SFY80_01090 [Verrucomicrobiota bacterium]|nr:hypothetical protein [Verrucomicrobiota bacterium]
MLNFAPILYARIHQRFGGPMERVISEKAQYPVNYTQAHAYLRPNLAGGVGHELFGTSDGSGTNRSPLKAVSMAISEALERWAHYTLASAPDGDLYGFDRDPSSTGMAAFPGLFARQARSFAVIEAWERYLLLSWWEGQLSCQEQQPWDGRYGIWSVRAPGTPISLSLVCHRETAGFYSYGFGAAFRFSKATARAEIERERSALALAHYYQQHPAPDFSHTQLLRNPFEKRVLFFSLPEGHQLFMNRTQQQASRTWKQPKTICDREIRGPWSRYAKVWRHAFDPSPFPSAYSPIPFYFYW